MQMLAALTERCAVPRGPLTLHSPGPGRLGVGSREVAETAVTCTVGMLTSPGVKGEDTEIPQLPECHAWARSSSHFLAKAFTQSRVHFYNVPGILLEHKNGRSPSFMLFLEHLFLKAVSL